ncbi:hypothetical protein Cgig2_030935 [Carnegiea gigantea]|uniref:Uncharacterized protein n=1 Tax=Carnegiea gigantea TaxID=171969 RepID=A0A9Q1GK97_9CARY|nr:hypothetical protein Cgig2_030935 [Carnegiea gigantea]
MVCLLNFTSTKMAVEYIRETFLWPQRETSAQHPRPLFGDHLILCPSFGLGVATRHAQDSNIPEMVQAIFHAMVVNEIVKQGITCRIMVGCLIWALQQLHQDPFEFWFENVEYRYKRARASRPINPPADLASSSGPVEASGLSDAPPGRSRRVGRPSNGGCHRQFPSLPTLIDVRVVAGIPQKNRCREPKNVPYAVPLFEPGTPSWSSCAYSSTPSILSPEVEVRRRQMAKMKSTPRVKTLDELLAEGMQGNPCSTPSPPNPAAKVASTITSSSSEGTSSSTSDVSSRRSSSEEVLTSSSSHEGPPTLGKLVRKRKGHAPSEPIPEIVAEGTEYPGAPILSDPQESPSSHFPDPKVVPTLKRTSLEKEYLLPAGYNFVIPKADAIVNGSTAKSIAVYCAALNCGLRFPLHPVIVDILTKYELAPAQVVSTSWHNICSFIATCEQRGLTCMARAFSLVHTIQRAPKETGDLGWYYFNNRPGFMTAIEKKLKVKY